MPWHLERFLEWAAWEPLGQSLAFQAFNDGFWIKSKRWRRGRQGAGGTGNSHLPRQGPPILLNLAILLLLLENPRGCCQLWTVYELLWAGQALLVQNSPGPIEPLLLLMVHYGACPAIWTKQSASIFSLTQWPSCYFQNSDEDLQALFSTPHNPVPWSVPGLFPSLWTCNHLSALVCQFSPLKCGYSKCSSSRWCLPRAEYSRTITFLDKAITLRIMQRPHCIGSTAEQLERGEGRRGNKGGWWLNKADS